MKTASVLGLVVVLSLLAGCQTTERVWYKEGATTQEFNMDQGQCRAQAFGAPGMNMLQVSLIYSSCMNGKGWYSVEQPKKQ